MARAAAQLQAHVAKRSAPGRRARPLPHRRAAVAAAAAQAGTGRVSPPPSGWEVQEAAAVAEGREWCLQRHPELRDLLEEGTLLVVPRRADYRERRSDGYQEPRRVWLLGTSHAAAASAAHVERVLRAVRPSQVVVELCGSRAQLLYRSSGGSSSSGSSSSSDGDGDRGSGGGLLSIGGESFAGALARSVRLGGWQALLLQLVLAEFADAAAQQAQGQGAQQGQELVRARELAEELGAEVVLGDRPIQITMQRAWGALSAAEKWALLRALLQLKRGGTGEELQQLALDLPSDAGVVSQSLAEEVMARAAAQFPALMPPLIHERDVYLGWSCKRSKAVDGAADVVGVMGRNHLRGVAYTLCTDQGALRFKDLVGSWRTKEASAREGVLLAARLVLETWAGFALWEAVAPLLSAGSAG